MIFPDIGAESSSRAKGGLAGVGDISVDTGRQTKSAACFPYPPRMRNPVAMLFLSLALVAVSAAASLEKVRFSNIKFDPGPNWVVAQQAPNMVLKPTNEIVKEQVRITIEPAATFTGTLVQGRDAAWTVALAGRRPSDEVQRQEEQDVEVGGKMLVVTAAVSPQGGVLVAVIKAGNKLTKLTLTADSDLAYTLGAVFIGPFLMSIEMATDETPPGGAGGGGLTTGPDPSDSFDWDGPDWFEYGVYDHGCRELGDEFDELVRENKDMVGAVKPREVPYSDAISRLRKMIENPSAKAQFDAANKLGSKEFPKLFVAGAAARMMEGDPFGALAHMLAGITTAPNDPDVVFNLASVLAQVGMPNESLAVLKQLSASGKKPQLAVGLKPDAAIAYLTGYNEMLRGNLTVAKAKLQNCIQADPFLNEASLCLSLIQAKQGGNGKKTYEDGAFRFKPKKLLFCGNDDTSQRPPTDDMFDTSKGKPGVLSDFRHPRNVDELLKFLGPMMEKLNLQSIDAMHACEARLQNNPIPSMSNPSPYDTWAHKMSILMEGLDEHEPLILKLQEDVEASLKDMQEAGGRHIARLFKDDQALAVSGKDHLCPDIRDNINKCLNSMRAYIVHYELMQRRYARTWYKMATGVNAHIGDDKWHGHGNASLREQLETLNIGLLGSMNLVYFSIGTQLAGLEAQCMQDAQSGGELKTSENSSECPPGMKGLGFKYSFEIGGGTASKNLPKLGFKVDCEKFTVDIEYTLEKVGVGGPLAEFGIGGFAQVEMAYKGDWTVFAGAKGSISALGAGVSEKAGIYAKGNARDGLTDLGGRVALDASGKNSEFTVSKKGDSMDFSIMPSPKAPKLGPTLKQF